MGFLTVGFVNKFADHLTCHNFFALLDVTIFSNLSNEVSEYDIVPTYVMN